MTNLSSTNQTCVNHFVHKADDGDNTIGNKQNEYEGQHHFSSPFCTERHYDWHLLKEEWQRTTRRQTFTFFFRLILFLGDNCPSQYRGWQTDIYSKRFVARGSDLEKKPPWNTILHSVSYYPLKLGFSCCLDLFPDILLVKSHHICDLVKCLKHTGRWPRSLPSGTMLPSYLSIVLPHFIF